MDDRDAAILKPDEGFELCYECDGDRRCWSCGGKAVRSTGERCLQCVGTGRCIVCNGEGQLPAGTEANLK